MFGGNDWKWPTALLLTTDGGLGRGIQPHFDFLILRGGGGEGEGFGPRRAMDWTAGRGGPRARPW